MKNIVNETPSKPTYAELENMVTKHDGECKAAMLIMLALFTVLAVCIVGWISSSSDVSFYKDYKNEYFDKWRACSISRTITPVDYIEQARLKARESELSRAEFEFQVKQVQWDAQRQVEEAKLQLQQERIILEREQVKFNNQAKVIDKVIKSVK